MIPFHRNVLNAALTSLILFFTLGSAATVEETFKKNIPFQPGGRIEIENVNGNITIEGWDKNEVYIEAEKRIKASDRSDAERLLKQLSIEIEELDNEIRITTSYPHRRGGGFLDLIFGGNISASVTYRIRVPNSSNIEATSTNGGVSVTQVQGKIRLRTTNGNISADNLKGLVSARTTNGSVNVELKEVTSNEEMEFLTTNGNITVNIPESIDCEVRARTTNGSIRTDFPLEVLGKYGSKHLKGKINEGGSVIFIETTNGSIKLLSI